MPNLMPTEEDGQPGPKDQEPAEKIEDKPLGPNGEKALAAEREARKKSDAELATVKAQMAGLAKALGVQPDEKADDDKVGVLFESVRVLTHNAAVDRVARDSGITDPDDLAILRDQSSEDAMKRLAARLKPAEKTDEGRKRRPLPPDPGQGRGGGEKVNPGDAGRAEAARRFKKQ